VTVISEGLSSGVCGDGTGDWASAIGVDLMVHHGDKATSGANLWDGGAGDLDHRGEVGGGDDVAGLEALLA